MGSGSPTSSQKASSASLGHSSWSSITVRASCLLVNLCLSRATVYVKPKGFERLYVVFLSVCIGLEFSHRKERIAFISYKLLCYSSSSSRVCTSFCTMLLPLIPTAQNQPSFGCTASNRSNVIPKSLLCNFICQRLVSLLFLVSASAWHVER
jgi:hypothetical protein